MHAARKQKLLTSASVCKAGISYSVCGTLTSTWLKLFIGSLALSCIEQYSLGGASCQLSSSPPLVLCMGDTTSYYSVSMQSTAPMSMKHHMQHRRTAWRGISYRAQATFLTCSLHGDAAGSVRETVESGKTHPQ